MAVAAIAGMTHNNSADTQFFVHGPEQVGKTHLAMAACAQANSQGYRVAYIPAEWLRQPEALVGLEQYDLVCVDEFEQLHQHAEEPWFHCINRCKASGTRLMFFCRTAVDELPLALPDLRTRLSWGAVFALSPLSDTDLPAALSQVFAVRGMSASEEVCHYILNRQKRDIGHLVTIVDLMDRTTLSHGRALTIPLVREALAGN